MKTLILGLGETGNAALQWCLRNDVAVRTADTRLDDAALNSDVLNEVETVVLSPGLAITDPPVAALLAAAQQRGISVISEIELFAQALTQLQQQQGYQPQVVAVTGTNGKTTVCQMLTHMVAEAGQTVAVAGNISPAALTALMHALDNNQLPDVWVLELSSFQLEHTFSLPLLAGVVLNVSQDHVDWHGSMQAYTQAKARIYAMSQYAIFNRDDDLTQQLATNSAAVSYRSFGLSPAPAENHNDMGLIEHHGQPWLAVGDQPLLPTASLPIVGQHNISNVLAALSIAQLLGIAWEPALYVLRSYYGEPHRCQPVHRVADVLFINDSKGTNVAATVAAIQGIDSAFVLIAGGVAKGQDLSPLATAIQQSDCKAVVLMGRDAPLLAHALSASDAAASIPVEQVSSLRAAVQQAFDYTVAGDAVLFSPACASLDMFKNYIERGEQFIEEVKELARDHGEVL